MDIEPFIKPGLQILGSAGTFVLGVLTERFKSGGKNRADRKRLRKALYAEIAANTESVMLYQCRSREKGKSPEESGHPTLKQWIRMEVYEEALKQPILYREIKESHIFSDIYLSLTLLKDIPSAEADHAGRQFTEWMFDVVKKGQLSRRELSKPGFRYMALFKKSFVPGWIRKQYYTFHHRNIKTSGYTRFHATDTLPKKIRALWQGLPGEPIK